MSEEKQTTDWAAWSRESVEMMVAKNTEWPRQFGLQGTPPIAGTLIVPLWC